MASHQSISKTCPVCQGTKPLADFSPKGKRCRPCQRLYGQAYYQANKTKKNTQSRAWDAAHREHIRRQKHARYLANLDEEQAKRRAWTRANQAAVTARGRLWRQAHPDQANAHSSAWRKRNQPLRTLAEQRRRARHAQAPRRDLTPAEWEEIKAAYGSCCVYCGRQMQRLTMDHLTPLSQGGAHTKQNVVPACKSCNSKKGTGTVLQPVQPLLL